MRCSVCEYKFLRHCLFLIDNLNLFEIMTTVNFASTRIAEENKYLKEPRFFEPGVPPKMVTDESA